MVVPTDVYTDTVRMNSITSPSLTFDGLPVKISHFINDWEHKLISNSRSPARAKRRAKMGYRQCVKKIWVLEYKYVVMDGAIYCSPAAYSHLLFSVSKGIT